MAAFVPKPNQSSVLASCPRSTSFCSKPFQTLQPQLQSKILPFPSLSFVHQLPRPIHASSNSNLPVLGFTTNSSPSPLSYVNRRSLFKSRLASQDSLPTTNDVREDTRNDVRVADEEEDQKALSGLMALIEAYKEAILNGEETTVSQIEVRILSIANKKNELIQKVSTLSAEKVASKEQYLRLQADFDNFRKRSDKERLNVQLDAKEVVIENLLLMVDNFERAKQQIKPTIEKEKKIDASYQGIYKQFVEILRSHHVAVVATVGKLFDPLLHEAIAREESQEFKEGIIIQESRRGFLLRDRLLRPALVKVSLGPGNKKSTVAPDKPKVQPSTAAGVDER